MRFTCYNCKKFYNGEKLPKAWAELDIDTVLKYFEGEEVNHDKVFICSDCLNNIVVVNIHISPWSEKDA